MNVWGCVECRATYRVWLSTCPRCKGPELKEYSMPKISVFGGMTDIHASGLLPAVASELPVEVAEREDGTVTEVAPADDETGAPAEEEGTGDPPPDGEDNSSGEDGKDDDGPLFDPGAYTVAEVKTRLEGLSDDERDRVIAAERAGKDRAGITG